jgi:hypothetical protein
MDSAPPLLSFLLMIAAGWVHRRQLIVIEFLQAENRLFKDRLHGRRIRFTDAERGRLARKAKAVGRKALLALDTIVSRLRATLKALRQTLKRRKHEPIPVIGKWLRRMIASACKSSAPVAYSAHGVRSHPTHVGVERIAVPSPLLRSKGRFHAWASIKCRSSGASLVAPAMAVAPRRHSARGIGDAACSVGVGRHRPEYTVHAARGGRADATAGSPGPPTGRTTSRMRSC